VDMFGALLVAAVTSASPSPLPIIITTKSSPICQTLREKIAPAISRVVYEDRVMSRQRPLGTKNFVISALAINWIELDKLLNPDTFFHSENAAENQRMESLRERLQKVADAENNSLNVLSGSYDTYQFEALAADGASVPGVLGAASKPNVKGELGAELSQPDGTPAIAQYAGPLEAEFLRREAQTQQAELAVDPELQPLIAQCK